VCEDLPVKNFRRQWKWFVIEFTKAHACGNDFLIVEQRQVEVVERASVARHLCARTTGVGADGLEYFEWLGEREGRICLYNADGSVAEISGNGTRCVAAWMAHQRGFGAGDVLRIQTDAGWRECRIVHAAGAEFEIVSGMGIPRIEDSLVRLRDGSSVRGTIVNTGNPHFVVRTDGTDFAVNRSSWQGVGEEICSHTDFPDQTNVEFIRVKSEREIELRIFERGVGPTSSSGTGTCAAGATAIAMYGCTSPLRVVAPGGTQQIEWAGSGAEIFLTGPAELIAAGRAFQGAQS
jgi:diaminopimelate epimerase